MDGRSGNASRLNSLTDTAPTTQGSGMRRKGLDEPSAACFEVLCRSTRSQRSLAMIFLARIETGNRAIHAANSVREHRHTTRFGSLLGPGMQSGFPHLHRPDSIDKNYPFTPLLSTLTSSRKDDSRTGKVLPPGFLQAHKRDQSYPSERSVSAYILTYIRLIQHHSNAKKCQLAGSAACG